MPLSTWISLAAVLVAGLSLVLARKDKQSQKTVEELRDLRAVVEGNRREISRLQDELDALERENKRLRQENYELLGRIFDGEERVPPDAYDGTDRRRRRR